MGPQFGPVPVHPDAVVGRQVMTHLPRVQADPEAVEQLVGRHLHCTTANEGAHVHIDGAICEEGAGGGPVLQVRRDEELVRQPPELIGGAVAGIILALHAFTSGPSVQRYRGANEALNASSSTRSPSRRRRAPLVKSRSVPDVPTRPRKS